MGTDHVVFEITLRAMVTPVDIIFAGAFVYGALIIVKALVKRLSNR